MVREIAALPAVKALTIRQPWAWAVIHGGKDVENRWWRTTYRGALLIHAAQTADPDPAAPAAVLWTMADPGAFGQPRTAFRARGAIIGFVHLADVLTDSRSRWAAVGRYHWVLEFPSPVDPPLPCPGRPGLWDPPVAMLESLAGVIDQ